MEAYLIKVRSIKQIKDNISTVERKRKVIMRATLILKEETGGSVEDNKARPPCTQNRDDLPEVRRHSQHASSRARMVRDSTQPTRDADQTDAWTGCGRWAY